MRHTLCHEERKKERKNKRKNERFSFIEKKTLDKRWSLGIYENNKNYFKIADSILLYLFMRDAAEKKHHQPPRAPAKPVFNL
jgi:hypothetical protein